MPLTQKVGAVLVAVVVIFVIVGLAGGGSSSSSSTPRAAEAAPEPDRPAVPPVEIAATALFRVYHENEVSADDAYKGKRLLVAGRVASIDKDIFDHIIVRLAAGGFMQTVDATMQPNQKAEAAALHKGATVSVLCTGNGLIMDPQLDDCVLQ